MKVRNTVNSLRRRRRGPSTTKVLLIGGHGGGFDQVMCRGNASDEALGFTVFDQTK